MLWQDVADKNEFFKIEWHETSTVHGLVECIDIRVIRVVHVLKNFCTAIIQKLECTSICTH